ncbi:MAG TPA: FliA/WhiG family RNA polymerase sigma factor [Symbiobacteriaceae bacterium]
MSVEHGELWRSYREARDPSIRDRLVEQYLWLVRYVAGRLMVGLPSHFDQGDLEGHGCFGLLEAIERYDLERGVRFETYAIPWVRGACLKGVKAQQWAPNMRKRVRQLEKAHEELAQALGREPSDDELAAHLSLTQAEMQERMAEAGCLTVLSLEESYHDAEGEGTTLAERLADPTAPSPTTLSEEAERRDLLAAAIDSLPPQERLVISLFYYEGLLAREISEILNLSQARISQIHSRAILRLRGKLSRMKRILVS